MQHPSSGRASWPSGDDNTGFYLLVILFGCAALSYLLWINYHGVISWIAMALHHQEIGALRYVTDRFDLADRQMAAIDPNAVTVRDLYAISRDLGSYVRIPAAAIMVLLAGICMIRAKPSRFRRAFDLDGLIREQAVSFPTTTAFANLRLRLVPPRTAKPRPADYALTPAEWIAVFATDKANGFDELKAEMALRRQLGPLWRGAEYADPVVRGLFAAFALHRSERRAEAAALLGRMSSALAKKVKDQPEGPEDFLTLEYVTVAAADVVIADHDIGAPALAITRGYAYTNTALMALLVEARVQAGVLAPAQFAWLKLVDRNLWYALHSLGFETENGGHYLHPNPRAEAVGSRAHWAVERLAGRPLVEPEFGRALEALRFASAPRSASPASPASHKAPAASSRPDPVNDVAPSNALFAQSGRTPSPGSR